MPTVTIDAQGRLVLPKSMRERLGLSPGQSHELHVWETGDGVMIEPEPNPASVAEAEDGLPVLSIEGVASISNDEVVAAIRRDRAAR